MPPEVSIIICTYNRADLLIRGLTALTAQSFPREAMEVILVDDGSTDRTPEVPALMESLFPKEQFRYIRLEKPPGHYRSPARARNVGLLAARGWMFVMTDPECLAARDAVKIHHRFHAGAEVDHILTTSPWMVSKPATDAMDAVDWQRDVHNLRDRFHVPEIVRATVDGPWFDAHFISAKKFWAYMNGGVNERFESWGFESTDFSRRLYWHGLNHVENIHPDAEVYHLWHDVVKGYGDRRMALIEGLLNGYGRASLLDAMAGSGADFRGMNARPAYGKARLSLLRMKAHELNALRDAVIRQAEEKFYPVIKQFRFHPPGDPIYGLDPWLGFRHMVDWDEETRALDWVNAALGNWPDHTGVLLEKAKLLLRIGRKAEASAVFKRVLDIDGSNQIAREGWNCSQSDRGQNGNSRLKAAPPGTYTGTTSQRTDSSASSTPR